MTDLRSKFSNGFRYLFRLPPPWEEATIFDRIFVTREGTIRKEADKDDGWLFACASSSIRIFDIGANIGQSAFLELYPESVQQVLLVDPNPMALSIAAENLIMNRLINRVNFECAFVSEQAGEEIEFYTVLSGAAGSIYKSHAKTAAKRNLHYKVSTTTIDDLVKRHGLPDFIKIDVEGAESNVLAGAKECLLMHKTRFLVEMHSNIDLPMVENARRVLDLCNSSGYGAWYLARKV